MPSLTDSSGATVYRNTGIINMMMTMRLMRMKARRLRAEALNAAESTWHTLPQTRRGFQRHTLSVAILVSHERSGYAAAKHGGSGRIGPVKTLTAISKPEWGRSD